MDYCRLLDSARRLRENPNRLQLRLLAYISRANEEARGRARIDAFKDALLIHRPDVYQEIYDEEGKLSGLTIEEEKEVEWVVPETEADVESMMAELRSMGYKG